MNIDLSHLRYLTLGKYTFCYSLITIFESIYLWLLLMLIDLDSLQYVNLGRYALYGKSDSQCTLKMQSDINILLIM